MPNTFSFNSSLGDSFIFGDMWDSIEQGIFVSSRIAYQLYAFVTYNSSGAQGDGINYKVWAKLGPRSIEWLGRKGPAAGIVTVKLNGVFVGDIDQYAAGPIDNQRWSLPATVLIAGEHTIQLICNTKNPASGGYAINVTYLRIK